MKTKQQINEKFDEKYKSVYRAYPEYQESHLILLNDIKNHISKIRQDDLDSLVEYAERNEWRTQITVGREDYKKGYNQALSDIITNLKSLKDTI